MYRYIVGLFAFYIWWWWWWWWWSWEYNKQSIIYSHTGRYIVSAVENQNRGNNRKEKKGLNIIYLPRAPTATTPVAVAVPEKG